MHGLKHTSIHKVTLRYNGLACLLLHVQALKKCLLTLYLCFPYIAHIHTVHSLINTHTHTHTQSLVTSLLLSFSPFSCFSHTQTSVSRFISLPPPSDPPSSAHKHKPSVAASHTLCLFHSQTCTLPADLSHFLSSHIHLTRLLPSPSVHTHTLLG